MRLQAFHFADKDWATRISSPKNPVNLGNRFGPSRGPGSRTPAPASTRFCSLALKAEFQ